MRKNLHLNIMIVSKVSRKQIYHFKEITQWMSDVTKILHYIFCVRYKNFIKIEGY